MTNKFKSKSAKPKTFLENLNYIMLGDGHDFGGRSSLHECGAKRNIYDPQIYTHFIFLIGGYLCWQNGLYDMLILLNIVIPLSTSYHYTYEQPGIIAQVEAVSAKVLFAYGFCQLFYPGVPAEILFLEISLLIATVFVFIWTNIHIDQYDPWHCLLHVASALWSILVPLYHGPLIRL
jgi:hypothetical protein